MFTKDAKVVMRDVLDAIERPQLLGNAVEDRGVSDDDDVKSNPAGERAAWLKRSYEDAVCEGT